MQRALLKPTGGPWLAQSRSSTGVNYGMDEGSLRKGKGFHRVHCVRGAPTKKMLFEALGSQTCPIGLNEVPCGIGFWRAAILFYSGPERIRVLKL